MKDKTKEDRFCAQVFYKLAKVIFFFKEKLFFYEARKRFLYCASVTFVRGRERERERERETPVTSLISR